MSEAPYLIAARELRDNPGQTEAYESMGACVILAGPGSGKTKTVTLKIAKILAEEVKLPRRVACMTYNNACVNELVSRLRGLGIEESEGALISSVHSFCLTELIIPFAQLAEQPVPDPIAVATPVQIKALFAEAVEQATGERQFRNTLKTTCERLRRTVIEREGPEWEASPSGVRKIVVRYEQLLLAHGLIDFDGMILTGVRLVEGCAWVRRVIKAKFPVVVVDEYQDLGLPLHRMVVSLMQQAGIRIIAVGDPDQSIYGFTGANPALLRELAGMQGIQSVKLKLNYRCAPSIVAASQSLLDATVSSEPVGTSAGLVDIHKTGVPVEGQAEIALTTIVPRLLSAHPEWAPGDVAFLYRTSKEGGAVARAADSLGITYFRSDGGAPIKHSRVLDWLAQAAKWCSGGWQTGTVTLSSLCRTWLRLCGVRQADTTALLLRTSLVRFLFAHRGGALGLNLWLHKIKTTVFEQAKVIAAGFEGETDDLVDLIALAQPGASLEHFTVEIFGNHGRDPERINLTSLHSSKGLEFQAVVMLGLEAGEFMWTNASRADAEEAVRLFYVGVTRAKSEVHLMYESSPTPFVDDIRRVLLD